VDDVPISPFLSPLLTHLLTHLPSDWQSHSLTHSQQTLELFPIIYIHILSSSSFSHYAHPRATYIKALNTFHANLFLRHFFSLMIIWILMQSKFTLLFWKSFLDNLFYSTKLQTATCLPVCMGMILNKIFTLPGQFAKPRIKVIW